MIDGSTGISIAAIAIVLAGAWAVWMRIGSLLANERMDAAGGDGKIDAIERDRRAETLADVEHL